MTRGEEAVAPVRLAVGRLAADVGDRDVRRQIVVRAAQRVREPRPGGGESLGRSTGIHEDTAGAVRIRFRGHPVKKRDVVDVPRHVR